MTRIRDSSLWMRRQLCPGCTYIVAVTLRHDELHDGFYVSLYGQLVSHVGGHLSCDQWPAASMTTVTGDLSVDCRPSVRPSVRPSSFRWLLLGYWSRPGYGDAALQFLLGTHTCCDDAPPSLLRAIRLFSVNIGPFGHHLPDRLSAVIAVGRRLDGPVDDNVTE